jgi:transposase
VVRVGTPLEEVERRVTMATLESCGRVKRTAARILGISLKTLYNRLEAYAEKDQAARGRETRPMPLVEEHELPDSKPGDGHRARRH